MFIDTYKHRDTIIQDIINRDIINQDIINQDKMSDFTQGDINRHTSIVVDDKIDIDIRATSMITLLEQAFVSEKVREHLDQHLINTIWVREFLNIGAKNNQPLAGVTLKYYALQDKKWAQDIMINKYTEDKDKNNDNMESWVDTENGEKIPIMQYLIRQCANNNNNWAIDALGL